MLSMNLRKYMIPSTKKTWTVVTIYGAKASVLDILSFKSSPLEVFLLKGTLKLCSKFTGENPCQIFRTPFSKNTSGGLLLKLRYEKVQSCKSADLGDFLLKVLIRIQRTKMKFFNKNFISKCERICRKLEIGSYFLKKFLLEDFIFARWLKIFTI